MLKIKLTDQQKFDAFFHVISITVAICAIAFSVDTKNEVNTYKTMVQELNTSISYLNSQIFNIKGDMNQEWNTTYNYEHEKSIVSLLNEAEILYDSQDYKELFEVYSDERLRENAIVLSNLGYMYANGYYVKQDLDMAEKYYNDAIEKGCIDAYNNKLSMYLKYCLDNIQDIIIEGYELGSNKAATFISTFSDSEDEDVKILYDFCNDSFEEQSSYINKMYYWNDSGVISSNSALSSDALVRYELLNADYNIHESDNSAGYIFTYRKYNLLCANLDILDEHFIKISKK